MIGSLRQYTTAIVKRHPEAAERHGEAVEEGEGAGE